MLYTNILMKIKTFLFIMLFCTKSAYSMQPATAEVKRRAATDQQQRGNADVKGQAADKADVAYKASKDTRLLTIDTTSVHNFYVQLPRHLKELITHSLLTEDGVVATQPEIAVPYAEQIRGLSGEQIRKRAIAEVKAAMAKQREVREQNEIYAMPRRFFNALNLNENGAAEKELLMGMNFHDLVISKNLMKLIPALVDSQTVEEIKMSLIRLNEVAQQQEFLDLEPVSGFDDRCIATEYVGSMLRWNKTGSPYVDDLYAPELRSFVAERLANGTTKFKIHPWYIQRIRELSPEQIQFILDLYQLKDPVNMTLIRRNHNGIVILSEAQAKIFLSLPLFIKQNILFNYPIGIGQDDLVHKKSKEFVPALRRVTPVNAPLTPDELRTADADNSDVLTKEEVAYIQSLPFEQIELLREMYRIRGQKLNIKKNACTYVSLPKEIQALLKLNYPLVSIGWMAWSKGMVQKHPKKSAAIALVATAGAGTIAYYGPKAVAGTLMSAGTQATPVLKAVTFRKVQKVVAGAALVATAAVVIDNVKTQA